MKRIIIIPAKISLPTKSISMEYKHQLYNSTTHQHQGKFKESSKQCKLQVNHVRSVYGDIFLHRAGHIPKIYFYKALMPPLILWLPRTWTIRISDEKRTIWNTKNQYLRIFYIFRSYIKKLHVKVISSTPTLYDGKFYMQ